MMEYILGPPGMCLLAVVVSAILVARAVLRATDAGAQLAKLIAKLDAEIRQARESVPETEARVAALKGVVPDLKRKYAAIDRYMSALLQLDADARNEEKDDADRRRALGSQKVDMGRG